MTKKLRHKLILTLTFSVWFIAVPHSKASNKDSLSDLNTKRNKFSIDYFLFPTVIYNSLTFGINYQQTTKIEHSVKFETSILLTGGMPTTSFNIKYNFNIYAKNIKNYLPIWLSLKNTLRDVGFEDGYFPNSLRPSIGLGFGRVSKIFKHLTTRIEFIAGASINLTNGKQGVYPFSNF